MKRAIIKRFHDVPKSIEGIELASMIDHNTLCPVHLQDREEWGRVDFVAGWVEPSGKGAYPVHLATLAKRILEGPAYLEMEVGRSAFSGSGSQYDTDWYRRNTVLAHIGRTMAECEALGTTPLGIYQMHMGAETRDDPMFYAMLGRPREIVIDLYGGPIDGDWLRRNTPRIERARILADRTGTQVTAFVGPWTHHGRQTPYEFGVFMRQAEKIEAVDNWVLWIDGGPDRLPYSHAEPFVRAFVGGGA